MTETVIRKATVGMKEGDVSVLSVVNSIFSPLTKKRVKELAMTEEQESKYVGRLSHEIESSGKDAAIANGIVNPNFNVFAFADSLQVALSITPPSATTMPTWDALRAQLNGLLPTTHYRRPCFPTVNSPSTHTCPILLSHSIRCSKPEVPKG